MSSYLQIVLFGLTLIAIAVLPLVRAEEVARQQRKVRVRRNRLLEQAQLTGGRADEQA
jgi:hypothetical protein